MITQHQLNKLSSGEAKRNTSLVNITKQPCFKDFLSNFFSGESKKIYELMIHCDGSETTDKGLFAAKHFHDDEDSLKNYHSIMYKYLNNDLAQYKEVLLSKKYDESASIFREYGKERTVEATSRFLAQALKGMISDCQRAISEIKEQKRKEKYQLWLNSRK